MSIFEFTRHGSRAAQAKVGVLALLTMITLVIQIFNQGRKPVLVACLLVHITIAALIVSIVARDKRR